MTFCIPVKVAYATSAAGRQGRARSWQWTTTTPQGTYEGCFAAPVTRSLGTFVMTGRLFTVQVFTSANRLLSTTSER